MKPESFPSWIYHETEPAYVCMTEAEFDALPAEWADHPDRVPKAVEPDSVPKPSAVQIAVPDAVPNESVVEAPKRRGRRPKAE